MSPGPRRAGCGTGVLCSSGGHRLRSHFRGFPTPTPVFCAKSAESLENKRVEFFVNAKKCKRVRKGLKGKGIGNRLKNHLRSVVTRSIVGRVVSSKMGIVGTHPGSFRPAEAFGMQNSHKSGKQRAYRIRNLEECTENGRQDRQRTERARMELGKHERK